MSRAFGTAQSFIVDPIEKKPLYHYRPGRGVLSFGTAGCNLGCRFCQNWEISKAALDHRRVTRCTAEQVVALAVAHECAAIAGTYNDPVIFAEWLDAIGHAAASHGVGAVSVTAGYVTREARADVFRHIAATNVDLKAFSKRFYRKLCLASLDPVLDTLCWLSRQDIWLEVTTLLIEGHNDSDSELRELSAWLMGELGPDVPLHFTAFHPDFRMPSTPLTSLDTLRRARDIARGAGLRYVYTGNRVDPEGQTTYCSSCNTPVLQRDGNRLTAYRLKAAACSTCGGELPGVFDSASPLQTPTFRAVPEYIEWQPTLR